MPYPHAEPLSLRQTTAYPNRHRRHSNTVLFQSLWGPCVLVHTRFEPSEHLCWEWGLILNANLPLLPSCWVSSFALGHGVSPHSRSCAYRLTGVFLTLDMGYLHTAQPVKCSHRSWPWTWNGSGELIKIIYTVWEGFKEINKDWKHTLQKTTTKSEPNIERWWEGAEEKVSHHWNLTRHSLESFLARFGNIGRGGQLLQNQGLARKGEPKGAVIQGLSVNLWKLKMWVTEVAKREYPTHLWKKARVMRNLGRINPMNPRTY